jgi:phage regulator Rha-like protein
MSKKKLVASTIESRIFTVRGMQVMLDSDLAEMYSVETKVLNQAVKRNIERFPKEFRFQLTDKELDDLRSQIVTLKNNSNLRSQFVTLKGGTQTAKVKQGQNIKYLPYAFTEQGVAMLSAVLRSAVAVQVSIQIMSAFVGMRKILANNQGIIQRLDGIEKKQLESEQKFEKIFTALEKTDALPSQGVFFDGQVFDAYQFLSKIIRSAKKTVVLIDNYVDETVLVHLSKKQKNVGVTILTKSISKQLELDVKKANEQYPSIKVKEFKHSHDRFLIIDELEVYHLGASLKDLGKKWFAFSKLDKSSVENILNSILELI